MGKNLLVLVLLCLAPGMTLRAATGAAAAGSGEWDGIAFQQSAPAGIGAWLVLPTRHVPDDADLPANGRTPSEPYVLRAARNEYECVQLVVMLAEPMRGASVAFGDFKSARGEMLAASAWKANKLGEVAGSWTDRAPPPLAQTWAAPATTTKRIADPLLPGKTFDLDRGLSRVWLSVHIPADAVPGDYAGVVRLLADGKAALEIPLRLRVWNHVIPDEPSLMVMADVPQVKLTDSRPLWDHLRPFYDDLHAHRINATGEIYPLPAWRKEQPPPDMSGYEQALRDVLDDLHFARFRFPHLALDRDGRWEGMNVFNRSIANDSKSPYADAIWIGSGSLSPGNGGGATLASYGDRSTTQATAVECEFRGGFSEPAHVWIQDRSAGAEEKKLISIDGKFVGILRGADFESDPLRFAALATPIKLTPGRHTLRIETEGAAGPAAASELLDNVLLTSVEHPDLVEALREQAMPTADFKSAYAYHARQTGEWLRQRGWLKKAHANLRGDDPHSVAAVDYGRGMALYDLVGDVLPSIRREICAEPGAAMLRRSIEVWTRPLGDDPFDPDRWPEAIKPGDELWASFPLMQTLGYPAVSMRLLPWLVGRHHFDGLVIGPTDSLIYVDRQSGEPIDSVRWELLREGLEDVETFRMLRTRLDELEAAGGGGAQALSDEQRTAMADAEELFNKSLPALIRSARDFSWDPVQLESARTRAGEALSKLTSPAAVRQPAR